MFKLMGKKMITVEPRNSKSYGLEVLFLSIENSNYREVDIKIHNPPKKIIIHVFFL